MTIPSKSRHQQRDQFLLYMQNCEVKTTEVAVKKRIDNFFDESALNDCQNAITRIESYLLNDWIVLLATDFYGYSKITDQIVKRRRVLQWLYCCLGWLTFIRFSLAAFIKDPYIWVLIADPFYLTENHSVFNLLIASIGLNSSIFRTLLLTGNSYCNCYLSFKI